MESETKGVHRKSRAPWQNVSTSTKLNNPYADVNTSIVSNGDNTDSLQVPNPYGTPNNAANRRYNRRMSVHVSAAAAASAFNKPGQFEGGLRPPLPSLQEAKLVSSEGPVNERGTFFDVESKIKGDLSRGTATDIEDYFEVLRKQKLLVTRDIKNNINQNQKNILELTNDLKDIQEESLLLRISTKELYSVLDKFKDSAKRRIELEQDSAPESNAGTRNNLKNRRDRSSVYVLEKMWVSELQSVYKHVDGASKFVQPIPGRHVLAESGRWFEVNVASWKQTKTAHLFLFNDMLMVAMKSSSTSQEKSSKTRLQAVLCWQLRDVELTTIQPNLRLKQDKNDKMYTINIRTSKSSYVYSTDRYDHYLKITEAYKKAKDELQRKEWARNSRSFLNSPDFNENEDEKKQLRKSLRNSGISDNISEDGLQRRSSSQRHSSDVLLQDISARVHSRNRSHDLATESRLVKHSYTDKGQYFVDLKTIEDRLDEVDVEISLNKYTESVGLIKYIENKLVNIEKALISDGESSTVEEIKLLIDVIKLKIANRKEAIEQSLAFDLQHGIGRLSDEDISVVIELFYNFGDLNKGIQIFLQSMSAFLSNLISQLVIEVQGSAKIDLVNYLSNLIVINVSVVKRAVKIYNDHISPIVKRNQQNMEDSSGLVNWTIEEFTNLSDVVRRHLHETLVQSSNAKNDENTSIIDRSLLNELIMVLQLQLGDLRSAGISVDYLFEDILSLS